MGLIPSITRTNGRVRDYCEEDLHWIIFIKSMRSAGLSVKSLIHYTILSQQGTKTKIERKHFLSKAKAELVGKNDDLQKTIGQLELKIKDLS